MRLTPQQEEQFRNHLQVIAIRDDCPVCRVGIDWVRTADLHSIAVGFAGEPARPWPVVRCTCPRCRQIVLFDATAIGLPLTPATPAPG